MTEQKHFPWLKVILGVGCVSILCIGILLAGGVAFFMTQRSEIISVPEPVVTVVVVTPTNEMEVPPPSPAPAPSPTDSGPTLTGNQHLDEYSLYDDFSSDALNWPLYDDGKTILKYEEEAYSIQIAEPDYLDWVYIPVDFVPYEMWFDVQGLTSSQDGTFGVFCHYQDVDNYLYVEFDLGINSYNIGQVVDGEFVVLMKQLGEDEYWYETDALKSAPESVKRIGVSCYLDSITLFINDQWVDEVSVSQPFNQPGKAAFFVYTFDFAGENGYKVFFDNVEVFQPLQ